MKGLEGVSLSEMWWLQLVFLGEGWLTIYVHLAFTIGSQWGQPDCSGPGGCGPQATPQGYSLGFLQEGHTRLVSAGLLVCLHITLEVNQGVMSKWG